jgi:hypothetical protein
MNRSLIILSVFVVVSFARLNPFEPVEKPNIPIEVKALPINSDDGNRTVKLIYDEPFKDKDVELVENEMSIEHNKSVKIETIPDINSSSKSAIIESNTTKKVSKVTKTPVELEEIPKPKLLEKCYKPLPFLTLDLKKNKLHIESRKKYKVKKLYTIPSEKKIVIDFYGNVKHYTKNGKFISEEFSSFKIGNHPEKSFFRVVIQTKHNTEKYIPVIEKNMLTITYNK